MNEIAPNSKYVLDKSKEDLNSHVESVVREIRESEEFVESFVYLTKFSHIADEILSKIKDDVIGEIFNNPTTYNGIKLSTSERASYDYSGCNDPVMNKLAKDKVEIVKKIKERAAFLKSIKRSLTVLDEESGEVVTIYPPVRSVTDSVTKKW